MEIIKKILSVIGIIALAFIVLIMIADDDTTPTQQPGNSVIDEQADSDDSIDEDEVDDDYYVLDLEDGKKKGILKPQSILENQYANMNDQRMKSIFTSIYNYDYNNEDVYISYIPNAEQTIRGIIKEPYAVGSVFNFGIEVTGGVASDTGRISGYIQGDDSLGIVYIDMSYIGDEKLEIMDDDVLIFDAIYAGLDRYSDPTFIALNMAQ